MSKVTKEQFDLLAKLLKSRGPVLTGVELVLFHNQTNAEAAREAGCTPQALHRSTKRFLELHQELKEVFR